MAKEKHFLDTSVLRPLESSSSGYQNYIKSTLSGDKYISSYIHKEYIMGLIIPMMSFYSIVRMPHVKNISDALNIWGNRFNSREIKSIMSMMSGLLSAHKVDFNELKEKDKASILIADYTFKCLRLLPKRYKFIGTDTNICVKPKHKLDYNLNKLDSLFSDYIKTFKNNNDIQSCGLSKFTSTKSKEIGSIKAEVANIRDKDDREKWEKILNGLENPTCPKCAKAGDTIISILSPTNMNLAHTDNSFDFLMPIHKKNHTKLESELAINKKLAAQDDKVK